MSPEVLVQHNHAYTIVVGTSSIVALVLLSIDILFPLPEQVDLMIRYCDYLLCAFFFIDFVKRFYHSEHKAKYFFTIGWLDLVSSIPEVEFLRLGRFSRLFGLFRLYRVYKAGRMLSGTFLRDVRKNAIFIAGSFALLCMMLSSVLILLFEHAPKSNIKTAWEAVWWSFVTMATVGYGDYYPVTFGGRLVGIFLMLTGISLFGVLTATFAGLLVGNKDEKEDQIRILIEKIEELDRKLQENKTLEKPSDPLEMRDFT